jgi:membrane protein
MNKNLPSINLSKGKTLIRAILEKWISKDIPMHGAALAFYTVFSLVPVLIIMVSMVGWLWGTEEAVFQVRAFVNNYLDPSLSEPVLTFLIQAVSDRSLAIPIISSITLIFGATTAIAQLKFTLNLIWNVETRHGKAFRQFLVDRVLALLIVLSLTLLLVISVIAEAILASLASEIKEIHIQASIAEIANQLVLWLTTFSLFTVVFKLLPDVKLRWTDVLSGSLLTTILFMLGKYTIGWYLSTFVTYSSFGVAGTMVVLLIWIYYNAQVIFLGAEITQMLLQLKGEGRQPKRFAIHPEKK